MRMQKITLNLVPEGEKPIVYASQFDNDRVIRFDLKDGEEDYAYSGTEAFEVAIRKPDDHLVTLEAEKDSETITVDDEPVTVYFVKVALDENSCACFGESICELKITDGEALIGSLNFVLDVERSPELNGLTSTDGIHNLTTQIEDITSEVVGENYYDKEEIDDKFDNLNIPTKTSQLTNDSGFITSSAVPTKTSQLTNDSGFITSSAVPTKTSQLTNDSGFITSSAVPTKTSQLTNDSGFTTIDDTATANDKTWSSNKINEELINILPTGTATGSIANFNTSLERKLVSCSIDENASHIIHCGSNVWDEETELGQWSDIQEKWIATTVQLKSKNYIPITPNTTFRLKNPTGTISRYVYYDKDKNYLSFTNANSNQAFTTPANAYYMMFGLATPYGTTYNNDVSINYPSTDTTYHAYNGEEVNISNKDNIVTYNGVNNIYTDAGDTTVTYKQSINDAIASLQAASNRSLSLMRTSIPEDVIEDNERGETNDQKDT